MPAHPDLSRRTPERLAVANELHLAGLVLAIGGVDGVIGVASLLMTIRTLEADVELPLLSQFLWPIGLGFAPFWLAGTVGMCVMVTARRLACRLARSEGTALALLAAGLGLTALYWVFYAWHVWTGQQAVSLGEKEIIAGGGLALCFCAFRDLVRLRRSERQSAPTASVLS